MIIDNQLVFSDHQAVTASAAGTNVLDLGAGVDGLGADLAANIGQGAPVYLTFQVTEDFAATASDASLTVSLTDCDTENGSFADVAVLPAVLKTSLVKGFRSKLAVPQETRRYLGVSYAVANGPFTAGKALSALTID